jgi:hypothetical protein
MPTITIFQGCQNVRSYFNFCCSSCDLYVVKFRSLVVPTEWAHSETDFCSPQEALGLPYLHSCFKTTPLRDPQCFNITCTLQDVREHSQWHPIFGYGIAGASTTPEDDRHLRHLDMPWLKLDDPEKYIEPDVVPEVVSGLATKVRHTPANIVSVPTEISTLQFLLSLPPAKRPYSWQEIKQQEAGSYGDIPSDNSSLGNASTQAQADSDEIEIQLPAGHAILRTYNQDIELLTPDYPNTLRTFFRGIVRQQLGNLRDQVSFNGSIASGTILIQLLLTPSSPQLRHFDRLNMLAVIPELSLVVAASQIGRAALITLTRLGDEFPSAGPVVMFRLDLILPLKMHEDKHRPHVPLAGMAVAPLQASERVRKEGWVDKRWRLILHYVDQTILSYELFRNEGEELIVL